MEFCFKNQDEVFFSVNDDEEEDVKHAEK